MQDYKTEEEIVESIKFWWQENGLSVVAGIALGLSLLFGWRAWQDYSHHNSELASASYQQMLNYFETKDVTRANEEASKILADYNDSLYASLASLALAKQQVEEGKLEVAQTHLQWVIDKKQSTELVEIANLRLAQLYVASNELDKAQALIDKPHAPALTAMYDELKGDLAVLKNDKAAARTAYQAALADKDIRGDYKNLIQMKLDNLGLSVSETVQAKAPKLAEPAPEKPQDALANPSTTTSTVVSEEKIAELNDAVANSSTQDKAQEVPQIEPLSHTTSLKGSEHVANPATEIHDRTTYFYTNEDGNPSTLNNRKDSRIILTPSQN